MSNPLDIKTFPLKGSRLIEASAGTGKTYTIALLYVRLVLGHGGDDSAFSRPLTPPEILVVTFTDAASQELNDRIRSRLSEAAAVFAGDQLVNKGDPLADILADYKTPKEKAVCALKLQRAAEWMDEAAVSTIHGWCYRMLREHAFDSHHLFTQKLLTDESELLLEVVQDYWRQNFYAVGNKDSVTAIQSAFASPDDLARLVKKLMAKPILSPVYAGKALDTPIMLDVCLKEASDLAKQQQAYQAEIDILENTSRECWKNNRADIESIIKSVKLNGNKYTSRITVDILLQQLKAWSEGGDRPREKLKLFATGRFVLTGGGQPRVHQAFDDIKALVEYEENSQPAQPAIPLQISIALHATEKVAETLAERKMSRAELGYNDMLIRLRQALTGKGGKRLACAIRQQYPVAMIDEFQDTDPVQYDIFNRIYCVEKNEAENSFVMIGDPKQAIYSFRGADIYTYIHARNATKGRHYTLARNHRSTEGLVKTINYLFTHAEAHERGAFRFQNGNDNPVPFQPVEFTGHSEVLKIDGQQVNALTCWYLNGMNEHGVTGAKEYINKMAETSAGEIARWLNLANVGKAGFHSENKEGKSVFRRLLAKDIAILVRTGKEAAAMRVALSDCGVQSVYLSDKESVFGSQEAKDMHRWLQAVAEPSNDRLIKPALATWSLGITHEALKHLVEDELQWEETVLRFRDYKVLWQQRGVLPMLRKLINDYEVTASLHEKNDGERMMTNVLHIAEWLQQASKTVDGEQALIRLLHEKIHSSTDDEDIIRLESDADLVKIVTIHKSKGLEYPLVLLPFICTSYSLDGKAKAVDFHAYDIDHACYEVNTELAGDPKIATESYACANDEGLSEAMRLLYVALTRAQHSVWLGVTAIGHAKNSTKNYLHESAVGYLLTGGKSIANSDLRNRLNALVLQTDGVVVDRPSADKDSGYVPAREQTQDLRVLEINEERKINDRWWVASYSALKMSEMSATGPSTKEPEDSSQDQRNEEEDESSKGDDQKPTFTQAKTMHCFPKGQVPGIFLHSLLEWAAMEGFGAVVKDNDKRREFIARCCQRRGWEMWIDMLSAWMKVILSADLPAGNASVCLANVERCLPELEFYFESRFVTTVQLDRLVREQTLDRVNRPELLYNELNGMLKGFIDLVFEYNGKYYVADWKSNRLGVDESAYTREAMCKEVLHHRYELQYTLYVLALHRHLQDRLPDYDYDKQIGGAVYVFLRGIDNQHTRGVHFEKPPRRLIEELDLLFAGAKSQELA